MKILALLILSIATAHAGQATSLNGWLASDTASKTVPLRRDAGDVITLKFPTATTRPDTVCVLAKANSGSIAGKTITLSFKLNAGANVVWWGGYQGGCTTPPNMRLYFTTRTGPFNLNYSDGKDPSSCWWSQVTGVALADVDDGTIYTMTALLDPATWTNAHGQSGTSLPADWARATSTALQVGLGFGIGCFYDTGVNDYYATGGTLHVLGISVQ